MKFENIRVYNFEFALRGMRNPKESWGKSDSYYGLEANNTESILERTNGQDFVKIYEDGDLCEFASIGPNDMKLAQSLICAGSEHRKFMRQIFVTVDITAPLFWWKEADTYKVGTTSNSTSTMHKLATTPIDVDHFEIDDYFDSFEISEFDTLGNFINEDLIPVLESLRLKYLETKDKTYWKELIRWLPESWLQTRTVTMNYENLFAMCSKGQRRFHKLTEWSGDGEDFTTPSFIKFARSLPYAQELIFIDELEQT